MCDYYSVSIINHSYDIEEEHNFNQFSNLFLRVSIFYFFLNAFY